MKWSKYITTHGIRWTGGVSWEAVTRPEYVRTTMKTIEKLAPDWDGEGADPPTQAAIKAARSILSKSANLPHYISPTRLGGIAMEWPGGLSIEIYSDGEVWHGD